MTIKEEIVQASKKVGMPEFKTVTYSKNVSESMSNHSPHWKTEAAWVDPFIEDIAGGLSVGILTTDSLLPYEKAFACVPPKAFILFVSSLFISAFEAGRAFEQNRQDAAIAELLERENHK